MLNGKTVLLGVTGGIAAYKAAALASALVKQHAAVEVVMTANATQFITPLTFEQLTGRRVMVDTFDRNFQHQVEHISLAERTDLVMIAPATANVMAKLDNPTSVNVPGNDPYVELKPSAFHPAADESCVKCGVCAEKCPVGAYFPCRLLLLVCVRF